MQPPQCSPISHTRADSPLRLFILMKRGTDFINESILLINNAPAATSALTRPSGWQVAAGLAALASLNRTVHLATYNTLIHEEALRLHAEAPAGAPAAPSAAGL